MRRRRAPQPVSPAAAGSPVTNRRKLGELETPPVDRISALPDELLGEIILLLPIKDGARTQALASRWRHLWWSVPLNLDCCNVILATQAAHLRDASTDVSPILSTHPGPVRRLCTRSHRLYGGDTGEAWLGSAALDSLEELEFVGLQRRLPASIFRFSDTLHVMFIADCNVIIDDVAQGLCFPRLKHLGLERVCMAERSLHGLIAGCPALEFLMVHRGYGFHRLRINSLTLRSVSVCINEPTYPTELQFGELVIEKAPSVERLIHLYVHIGMNVSVLSAPNVETLGFLTDWQNVCKRLERASIRGLRVNSPTMTVHAVKSIAVNMSILSLDSIIDMMRLFPYLEKLHVKSMLSWKTNCWRRKHSSFIKCHYIRLKALVLEPYLGTSPYVNFASFFILNARELESMTFQIEPKFYNAGFLTEQHRKLQLDNKASKGARFHFRAAVCQHANWSTKHLRDFDLNDPFLCGC